MDENQAREKINKLKKLINHHRYLYHVLNRTEISQAALDFLKKELFDLEQKYPQFITPDSPTQRVGGKPLEKFEKVRHPLPMLSFNDGFSKKDMENWLERNSKLLTKDEISKIDYYCEPKLDGLAIELIFEEGVLKTGSTRGDGLLGEDVTQNLKTIESIPLKLREVEEVVKELDKEKMGKVIEKIKESGLKEVVVRGEAIISKKNFEKVNKEQKKEGLNLFANPRNLAAGSIRQLDPKIAAQRKLDVVAYDLISDFGQETHEQEHKILWALGFKANNEYSKRCNNLDEVFAFREFWQKHREKLPFEIDGLVVTLNNNKIFEKLGIIGKAPRGAIAFKFPLKEAVTRIEAISVQVGRTGSLTPVAFLKPVEVGGVTISRATLHNEDEIKRLGLKIGDSVVVGRAGDVIPHIIRVLEELRNGKEKEFHFPKNCPVCGKVAVKNKNEVVSRCENLKCPAKERRYFYHFISKGAFDIAGLGPKVVERLIDQGLIQDPGDLFELKEGDLEILERFAEKSAQNLVQAIQLKKKISLPKFIYALGIRNVGEETARSLTEYFGSIDKLKEATSKELEKIKDIGPVVAKSIYDFFKEKRNLNFLTKLKKVGVEIISEKQKGAGLPAGEAGEKLKGKTFVLTGSLESMSREKAKEKIRELGGFVSESVTKKTDFVVFGREPGLKFEKAKKLGLEIINEKQFLAILGL